MTEAQYHTLIKDMPAAERPRERLIYHGAEVLSNAELLAITLRVGSPSENVVSLAQRLLSQFDGLGGLARASVAELCTIPGIGPAKATQLKAALELGKRMASYGEATRPRITCPDDAAPRFIAAIGDGQQEQFCVLHLDNKNAIIRMSMVYQGSVNAAVMRLGEVFREAVRDNAVRVIGHNHPSGDLTPSPEDIQATREIVVGNLDIEVLTPYHWPRDHSQLRSLAWGWLSAAAERRRPWDRQSRRQPSWWWLCRRRERSGSTALRQRLPSASARTIAAQHPFDYTRAMPLSWATRSSGALRPLRRLSTPVPGRTSRVDECLEQAWAADGGTRRINPIPAT